MQTFSRFPSPIFDTETSTTAAVVDGTCDAEDSAGLSFTVLRTEINSYTEHHHKCTQIQFFQLRKITTIPLYNVVTTSLRYNQL